MFVKKFIASLLTMALILLSVSSGPVSYADTDVDTDVGTDVEKEEYVVVINAGHQSKNDLRKESYAPGSDKKKYRVTSGTRGIATKVNEGDRNLQVAKRLAKDLEAAGIKVYLTRTKNNVNISNSSRAKFANKLKADLVISLHCDACGDKSVKGITMLVPKKNKWTKKIYPKSLDAGKIVLGKVIGTTKAKNRGISKRSDITGFNYSKVPTILIEMGFMTNKNEDRKLATAGYQKKLSKGMAKGIIKYLNNQEIQ